MNPLIQIKILETDEGEAPFEKWYFSIRDRTTRIRIRTRLERIALGNFGDVKSIDQGISELRLHFGAGYRVYFAQIGTTIIVLMGGGDKSTQEKDIKEAISLWRKYKNEAERYGRELSD